MPKNIREPLSEQQMRRKRVAKIKNGIIIVIALWMLLSLLAVIILSVQVAQLQNDYHQLREELTTSDSAGRSRGKNEQNKAWENGTEQFAPESPIIQLDGVQTGIDEEDNLYHSGDQRKVYLTFDCIPGSNTDAILDVLRQSGVKATFFAIGDESENAQRIYRRIVDEGHTLGMHSYSNTYSKVYASVEAFSEDVDRIQKYLSDLTGRDSVFYRFPGGSFNEIGNVDMAQFVNVLNRKNLIYFDWNVSGGDAVGSYSPQDVVQAVTSGVERYKTSVVLLHDSPEKGNTAAALGEVITSLKGAGMELLPIDQTTYQVQYIKSNSVK